MAQQGLDEEFYSHVDSAHSSDMYDTQERMAIEYAERFALDHLAIDEAFFARLREHFDDAEILDLTICVADYLAFGRLTQVLKLDQECTLDGVSPETAAP